MALRGVTCERPNFSRSTRCWQAAEVRTVRTEQRACARAGFARRFSASPSRSLAYSETYGPKSISCYLTRSSVICRWPSPSSSDSSLRRHPRGASDGNGSSQMLERGVGAMTNIQTLLIARLSPARSLRGRSYESPSIRCRTDGGRPDDRRRRHCSQPDDRREANRAAARPPL